jgi:hypothetical protein
MRRAFITELKHALRTEERLRIVSVYFGGK